LSAKLTKTHSFRPFFGDFADWVTINIVKISILIDLIDRTVLGVHWHSDTIRYLGVP